METLGARNPVPPELADATPVVARPRPVAKPGYPSCWVEVSPPRTTEHLAREGVNIQCSASCLMDMLMAEMARTGVAGGAQGIGSAADGGAQAAASLTAGLAVPPAPAPLLQPQLLLQPHAAEGHPDLRALLHDEQRLSLRLWGEAKKNVAPTSTPSLVAQPSSAPDTHVASQQAKATRCEGAQL